MPTPPFLGYLPYAIQRVEVEGIRALDGGSLEDPNVEPWFQVILYINGSVGYDAVTKDGISFRYYNYDSMENFSLRDGSIVKKAIERYVDENLCGGEAK